MKHIHIYCFVLSCLLFISCEQNHKIEGKNYTKIWAHRINDTISLHEKQKVFQGFEIDLIYSSQSDELFVGHDFEDTIKRLTFHTWLNELIEPTKIHLWIDIKSEFLNKDNASVIAKKIIQETLFFKMNKNFFVECRDAEALHILKEYDIPVCLWLDDIPKTDDTREWLNYQKQKIKDLSPQAISCEYCFVNFVAEKFPNMSIYTWHTPVKYTPQNILKTQKIANIKNVEIVLVDYPECINY